MFRRRNPHTPLQHARELFWPSMGWRRAFHYVRLRILRLSDSTHRIAAGLACGTSIAFTPVLGTHFIQAGLLAWVFRLNILAAIIGTFLCNPWTLPFMWWGSIKLGGFLFSFLGVHVTDELPHHMTLHLFWQLLIHKPVDILLPWLTGGYLLALLAWVPAYVLFYRLVQGAKTAQAKIRLHAAQQNAQATTGEKK